MEARTQGGFNIWHWPPGLHDQPAQRLEYVQRGWYHFAWLQTMSRLRGAPA